MGEDHVWAEQIEIARQIDVRRDRLQAERSGKVHLGREGWLGMTDDPEVHQPLGVPVDPRLQGHQVFRDQARPRRRRQIAVTEPGPDAAVDKRLRFGFSILTVPQSVGPVVTGRYPRADGLAGGVTDRCVVIGGR